MISEKTLLFAANIWYTFLAILLVLIVALGYFNRAAQKRLKATKV